MPRWALTEASCGAVVEADDALAAFRTFWSFYRPGPVPDTTPDGYTVTPADEKDVTMSKLADLDRRLSKLEARQPADAVRIVVEYVNGLTGTVVRRVRYIVGQDPQDVLVDGDAA